MLRETILFDTAGETLYNTGGCTYKQTNLQQVINRRLQPLGVPYQEFTLTAGNR